MRYKSRPENREITSTDKNKVFTEEEITNLLKMRVYWVEKS